MGDSGKNNLVTISGSTIRVVKKTEYGLVLQFRAQTKETVRNAKPFELGLEDDDDAAITSQRNDEEATFSSEEECVGTKRKSDDKERALKKKPCPDVSLVTTYKDYYLCGELCGEITSPLVYYKIEVVPSGGFYSVNQIVSHEMAFKPPLTKTKLKKALRESQYFSGAEESKARSNAIERTLAPLVKTHGLNGSTPITDARVLQCLSTDDSLRYACKNLFKDHTYYERISLFGLKASNTVSEEEFSVLLRANDDDDGEQELTDDDDIDSLFADQLTGDKLEIFESVCFANRITEEQCNSISKSASFNSLYSKSRVLVIFNASQLYHDLFDTTVRFLNTCIKSKVDDDRWEETSLKILEEYVYVQRDFDTSTRYALTNKVHDVQTESARILNGLESLTIVRAENDTDHNVAQSGYFSWLRTTIKENRADLIVVSSLKRRKQYLKTQTNFSLVHVHDESTGYDGGYSVVIVDRCNLLGLEEFHRMLKRFKGVRHLYLCGSLLCLPETAGQPFQDICDHEKTSFNINVEVKYETISDGIQTEKIRKFFDTAQSMIKECKPLGLMYIVVDSSSEKEALSRNGITEQIGRDSVISIRELKSDIPASRPTTAILLSGEAHKMNKNKIAKAISCASTKEKSVVVIGNRDDYDRVMDVKVFARKTTFSKDIVSHSFQE